MNIWLIHDTSGSINWGCVATTGGIRRSLTQRWPDAQITAFKPWPLPFRRIRQLRKPFEWRLMRRLLDPQCTTDQLRAALASLNCRLPDGPLPDRVYINGEGAMHHRSSHLTSLLGAAMLIKRLGGWVAVVNQSIDLGTHEDLRRVVAQVFAAVDHVTVRDPLSLRQLQSLGVGAARLVPDAAFALEPMDDAEASQRTHSMNLPGAYVALTGSSALGERSAAAMQAMAAAVKQAADLPLVMLASTKTDQALGRALCKRDASIRLIESPAAGYRDAVAVIRKARMLVGGRFHPMIFAALQGVPIVALEGNTHKLDGLIEMLGYPAPVLCWGGEAELMVKAVRSVHDRAAELGEALRRRAEQLAGQVCEVTGLS
jgi:polysaccharide pyruvyl transferase WcaK-like protein